jgi:hypothetical protein
MTEIDKRVSQLPEASLPLTGSEILAVTQDGESRQTSINSVLAQVRRRSHGASWYTLTGGALVAPLAATIEIAAKCQITSYNVLTQGGAGSCIIDIWKLQKPTLPTSIHSICGISKPTITSGTTLFSSNFTGWSTLTFQAGDLVTFYLQSNSGFTNVSIQLMVEEIP